MMIMETLSLAVDNKVLAWGFTGGGIPFPG